MRYFSIFAAAALAGLACAPAAGAQAGAPYGEVRGAPSVYDQAVAQARSLVQEFMAERGVPGVSVAVGVDGQIVWSEGFGYANVEHKIPVTPQTRFRGGSTSKPMTQAAASLLREQGRFDFDAPIQRYVPSFPDKGHVITPRHLMGHTAGIRHYPPEGDEFMSTRHYPDIVEALEIFQDDPLLFPPGTDQSYSTYGANLLGAAVQGAAGENFLAVLHKLVFQPLGMRSTVGDHPDSIIPHRTGYYERTNQRPHYHLRKSSWGDGSTLGVLLNAPYVDNSNKWAGGGLLTTPEDLVRFGSAHLEPGYLRAETLDTLFAPVRLASGEVTGRGLNWVLETDDAGRRIVSHGGGGIGSNSALRVHLDDGVVVAVQANLSQSNPDVVAEPIAGLFVDAVRSSPRRGSPAARKNKRMGAGSRSRYLDHLIRGWDGPGASRRSPALAGRRRPLYVNGFNGHPAAPTLLRRVRATLPMSMLEADPRPQTAGYDLLQRVDAAVHRRVVGQNETVQGLLIALLTGGHLLLEGLPGLAKTLLVRSLADALNTTFRRIQFTPDLLPGDIVGTPIYHQGTGEFRVYKGPIFANIVLADEVNRAPPKVQSALLEAMEEEQVTIDGTTYPLPSPFLVLATQNPIEQQGTYPLAEAQLDRFMMKLRIGYPKPEEEREIIRRVVLREGDSGATPEAASASGAEILDARRELEGVHVHPRIQEYVVRLVFATREPASAGLADFASLMEFGISPRATIFLTRASRAHAFLQGRDFVLPDDVKAIAPAVLRHRIRTTYEADARGIDADQLVARLLATVPSP